jgi:nickel transport protein
MVTQSLPALAGALALLLAPALAPQPVRAHAIESNLEHLHLPGHGSPQTAEAGEPDRMRLQSSFSSGEPVVAAAVRLVPPNGAQPHELGRTDTEGRLTFTLPPQARANWELQVDGGPGHRDYLELPGVTAREVTPAAGRGEFAAAARQLGLVALVGSLGLGGLALRRRRS